MLLNQNGWMQSYRLNTIKIRSATDADDIYYMVPYVIVMCLAAAILDNGHTEKNKQFFNTTAASGQPITIIVQWRWINIHVEKRGRNKKESEHLQSKWLLVWVILACTYDSLHAARASDFVLIFFSCLLVGQLYFHRFNNILPVIINFIAAQKLHLYSSYHDRKI